MAVKWIVGSDHAGLPLKDHLVGVLEELGDEVDDIGTHTPDSVDYPDFAAEVARRVADGEGLGLLVCGTGIGMAMTANKVPGVRAAVVTDCFTARMTRAHNDANVMAIGQRVVGTGVAEEALRAFRDTPFEGGRHQVRVDKINELDDEHAALAEAAAGGPAPDASGSAKRRARGTGAPGKGRGPG